MTAQGVTGYCLSKPGTVLDYSFSPEPVVFKVGGKIFATVYQKDGSAVVRKTYGLQLDKLNIIHTF